MPKRKIHIITVVILAVIFAGVLVGIFSRPASANVSVTFAGFTTSSSPFGPKLLGSPFTNASFSVSNAGPAKVRLTFRNYQFNSESESNYSTVFVRPSGLGILCVLEPGQSTNLVVPFIPIIRGFSGPEEWTNWRIEFSSRRDWFAKLDQQPKWLQTAVTKIVPDSWMANLYRADIVSDWITNREPAPDVLKMLKASRFTNTNTRTP
jgi:hypothetical protein